MVGLNPIVHAIAHDIRVKIVPIAHGEKDTKRFFGAVGDDSLMKIPGATGCLRVERPLLIHKRAGGGEHAVVQVRAIPCHDQGGGTAGTVAHHRATIGIPGELHAAVFFHQWQHFSLDVLGEESGHGVVLFASLMPLRIATAVGHHDGDLNGDTFLSNQVVENPRDGQVGFPLGAVVTNNERSLGSGAILGRNINRDLADVIDLVRVHD